jgi:hypothetical protein
MRARRGAVPADAAAHRRRPGAVAGAHQQDLRKLERRGLHRIADGRLHLRDVKAMARLADLYGDGRPPRARWSDRHRGSVASERRCVFRRNEKASAAPRFRPVDLRVIRRDAPPLSAPAHLSRTTSCWLRCRPKSPRDVLQAAHLEAVELASRRDALRSGHRAAPRPLSGHGRSSRWCRPCWTVPAPRWPWWAREGVVGVCAFMGGGKALSSAVVQRPGLAWRMGARDIADLARD